MNVVELREKLQRLEAEGYAHVPVIVGDASDGQEVEFVEYNDDDGSFVVVE